jgi:hypothetical protein
MPSPTLLTKMLILLSLALIAIVTTYPLLLPSINKLLHIREGDRTAKVARAPGTIIPRPTGPDFQALTANEGDKEASLDPTLSTPPDTVMVCEDGIYYQVGSNCYSESRKWAIARLVIGIVFSSLAVIVCLFVFFRCWKKRKINRPGLV